MKTSENTRNITITALCTTIVFLLTYMIKIPLASGYVHFGDAALYMFAAVLDAPFALIAGAFGEMLADIAGGYAVYAPFTFVIKALMAGPFILIRKKSGAVVSTGTVLMALVSGIICVSGYFCCDLLIARAYAVADIIPNIIQASGSLVIFTVFGSALERSGFFERIGRKNNVKNQ